MTDSATKVGRVGLTVRCRLFGRYAELAGARDATLAVPAGATVAEVLEALRRQVPGAEALPAVPLVAVNCQHAALDWRLADGDEVAVLPPLAGG